MGLSVLAGNRVRSGDAEGNGKGGTGGGSPGSDFYWKVLRRFSHKRV